MQRFKKALFSLIVIVTLNCFFSGVLYAEEVKGADFVVNVWDMETLPKDFQSLVLQGKECDIYQRCKSSAVIGGPLRRCLSSGVCARAEKSIRLKLSFSLKPELNGEYDIVGTMHFLVPYGTKVVAEVISPRTEVPVGAYILEGKEWDLDRNILPGDVARLHGHWVLSTLK